MQRCRIILMTIFFTVFFGSTAFAELPSDYQLLSNAQKQDVLWTNITKSNELDPLPEMGKGGFWDAWAKLKGLFHLAPSFDHESDEMPEGRQKIIHANGSVGKMVFVPATGHPFTGIYESGDIGFARLSLAVAPSDTSFVPGMAIKFLIQNHASLNLQVMNALDGQGADWNFFAKDFSNKIEHPTGWVLKAIEKIFAWTRSPANDLPVSHLASWNGLGEEILDPISPEQLYFRPSESVNTLIDPSTRKDFRLSLGQIPYGSLYEVYGDYQGKQYHIGSLMLESKLLASHYGDEELFFQHQR